MDKDTRDALLQLTADVSRLSAVVESHVTAMDGYMTADNERHADKEKRVRKVERWMYALPGAYVLTLGTVFTTVIRTSG